MKSIEESVISALDAADIELFSYLPYILQDLWEMGTPPEIVIDLVFKHAKEYSNLKVLDLGCGKGAVSIKLSHKLKCQCYGIDAVKEFIDEAKIKAHEFNVVSLCKFEVNDIRTRVKELSGFDVAILGAVGSVMGDYYSTLTSLTSCLNQNGIIIIDDGYIEDDSTFTHPLIQKRKNILYQIEKSGMRLIDEVIIKPEEIKTSNDLIFEKIKMRCGELIEKYPDKSSLFLNYIKRQEEENNTLETKIVCSTMVIKKFF
jgi:2-polyprenyl-3-methyl-5-hydroxy-6-metoxy-1,4-benzoquinol methylase